MRLHQEQKLTYDSPLVCVDFDLTTPDVLLALEAAGGLTVLGILHDIAMYRNVDAALLQQLLSRKRLALVAIFKEQFHEFSEAETMSKQLRVAYGSLKKVLQLQYQKACDTLYTNSNLPHQSWILVDHGTYLGHVKHLYLQYMYKLYNL